jgi:hypothetical protein
MEVQKRIRRFRGSGWLFRRPGSAFWWCGYYRNGKLYRESTHAADERSARRFLQRKLGEVASDNFIAPQTARMKAQSIWRPDSRRWRAGVVGVRALGTALQNPAADSFSAGPGLALSRSSEGPYSSTCIASRDFGKNTQHSQG